ncbi:hypothetical protein ACD591_11565 [Rufibacter glacialis]|uniref:Uncharacterized protein n=1 Tax=Rufibacter glacialis TaxID=1259555 RepID=A0A5M8QT61_9BACT|nr:hypothetical protein [Rufibacter glacialis]KAA6437392.1 hypothetical protein FOE74_02510 [Rufibacter glacialis]GGK59654.1 hypothetical protein GCM10011405_04740 [Rufibacter glacialis]
MDLPPIHLAHEFEPLPPELYCEATGQPFHTCITCDGPLLRDGVSYLVEKAVRFYPKDGVQDITFEYAMCLGCAQKLREELSVESRNRIDAFFAERVNLVARREALLSLPNPLQLDHWLSHCLVTGRPREACKEYQIYAQCDGPDLLYTYMPYLISGEAMEEIQELISPHTRQILDDFMDTHFGLPPELRALLQDKLILI